jgi:hypothetical protein
MRVWEMITHRLGLAETGHFCLSLRRIASLSLRGPFLLSLRALPFLSLRGAAGDVAISLALNSVS